VCCPSCSRVCVGPYVAVKALRLCPLCRPPQPGGGCLRGGGADVGAVERRRRLERHEPGAHRPCCAWNWRGITRRAPYIKASRPHQRGCPCVAASFVDTLHQRPRMPVVHRPIAWLLQCRCLCPQAQIISAVLVHNKRPVFPPDAPKHYAVRCTARACISTDVQLRMGSVEACGCDVAVHSVSAFAYRTCWPLPCSCSSLVCCCRISRASAWPPNPKSGQRSQRLSSGLTPCWRSSALEVACSEERSGGRALQDHRWSLCRQCPVEM
jgi:hypothetical protein